MRNFEIVTAINFVQRRRRPAKATEVVVSPHWNLSWSTNISLGNIFSNIHGCSTNLKMSITWLYCLCATQNVIAGPKLSPQYTMKFGGEVRTTALHLQLASFITEILSLEICQAELITYAHSQLTRPFVTFPYQVLQGSCIVKGIAILQIEKAAGMR